MVTGRHRIEEGKESNMAQTDERLGEVSRILELAAAGTSPATGEAHAQRDEAEAEVPPDTPGCTIRVLPGRLGAEAAGVAMAVNPANAPPNLRAVAAALPPRMSLTGVISKFFGPKMRTLTVSFLEQTPADLQARILAHMNAWSDCCGFSFPLTTGRGQVRISRGGAGYWSYLGTDILLIPRDKPTMNLQGFTMSTPESEYRRVVRHETGHTLGFAHEHMRADLVSRIDPQKAYDYFGQTQGWDERMVDIQVLTPLNEATIMGTPADQTSVMCYQLPGDITTDGRPIVGGNDINATDCAFAGRLYPKSGGKAAKSAKKAPAPKRRGMAMTGGGEDPIARMRGFEAIDNDWSADKDVDALAVIEEFRAGE